MTRSQVLRQRTAIVRIGNLAQPRQGESGTALYARLQRTAAAETLEMTLWQDLYHLHLTAGWPEPHPQLAFHPVRRWRFDFAYMLPHKLAIEVDGGTWSGGRHVRGGGFAGDAEKLNEAAIAGWRVLHLTAAMVKSKDGAALEVIRRALHMPAFTEGGGA